MRVGQQSCLALSGESSNYAAIAACFLTIAICDKNAATIKRARMKILAVDDEPYILELMPLLAARVGFSDVTTFSSAVDALDTLVNGKAIFDCLLLDINMPDMDGIELCRCVRLLEAYRSTPIIMLTAMSERDYMDRAFKAGATDYATKPFDINELGARLRIAEQLIAARQEAKAAKERGSVIHRSHGFDVTDAIRLEGGKDLIDRASLLNYLRQSSRSGLAASQIIAIKLDRIEDIYDHTTTEEFTYALREVADSIREILQRVGVLISYVGKGIFLVLSNSATPLRSCEIESEVQHLLDTKNFEYNSGAPMDLEISVGNPIQPNASSADAATKSLETAIARAENRSTTKNDKPPTVNIKGHKR